MYYNIPGPPGGPGQDQGRHGEAPRGSAGEGQGRGGGGAEPII